MFDATVIDVCAAVMFPVATDDAAGFVVENTRKDSPIDSPAACAHVIVPTTWVVTLPEPLELLITETVPDVRASGASKYGATSNHCPVPIVVDGADAGSCTVVAFEPFAVPHPIIVGTVHPLFVVLFDVFAMYWAIYSNPLFTTLTLFATQSSPCSLS